MEITSPTPATDRVAMVFQPHRNTVRIRPKPGYEVSLMVGATVEAYISALDGTETVILKLAPVQAGEKVVLHRHEDHVDLVYETSDGK